MSSNEYHGAKCRDCDGSGTVAIYAHRTVRAVKLGQSIRFAYQAVAVCNCTMADKKYGSVMVDDQPIRRFEEEQYCRLPSHYYTPTPETVDKDIEVIRAWLDGRGTARVGEFTAEDWRG